MNVSLTDLLDRSNSDRPAVDITSDLLIEASDQLVKERRERAVKGLKGLIDNFTAVLQSSVRHLKQVREQEAMETKMVKAMDRAVRYFGVTGNPLPFYKAWGRTRDAMCWCEQVGIPFPQKDDDPAWIVPENWTPEAAAAK